MANRTKRNIRKTTSGKLYLLWGEGTHSFKVGFTRGFVNNRAYTIEAYSPVRLRILGQKSGSMEDEKDLHGALSRYRSHGEWFVLPEPVVWRLLEFFGHVIPENAVVEVDS